MIIRNNDLCNNHRRSNGQDSQNAHNDPDLLVLRLALFVRFLFQDPLALGLLGFCLAPAFCLLGFCFTFALCFLCGCFGLGFFALAFLLLDVFDRRPALDGALVTVPVFFHLQECADRIQIFCDSLCLRLFPAGRLICGLSVGFCLAVQLDNILLRRGQVRFVGFCFLVFDCRFPLLCLLHVIVQSAEKRGLEAIHSRFGLILGEAERAGQIPIVAEHGLFLLCDFLRSFYVGIIYEIKPEQIADLIFIQKAGHCMALNRGGHPLPIREQRFLFLFRADGAAAADVCIFVGALCIRQRQTEKRLGVLRIHGENLVVKTFSFVPCAIFQCLLAALQERSHIRPATLLNDNCFLDGFGFFLAHDLFHAADKILHGADLAHVLSGQFGKLLGHVIGVHVLEHRDQGLFLPRGDQLQKAAPLVLDPDGVEVFVVRADHQHHFRAVQGREDVRLVLRAELVLQRDPGEEHAVALVGQFFIDVLCDHAVQGAVAV